MALELEPKKKPHFSKLQTCKIKYDYNLLRRIAKEKLNTDVSLTTLRLYIEDNKLPLNMDKRKAVVRVAVFARKILFVQLYKEMCENGFIDRAKNRKQI